MPVLDRAGRPLHPVLVGPVQQDRHAAQRLAPLHHRGIEVRVRDEDAIDTTTFAQHAHRGLGDEAHALPQQIACIRG